MSIFEGPIPDAEKLVYRGSRDSNRLYDNRYIYEELYYSNEYRDGESYMYGDSYISGVTSGVAATRSPGGERHSKPLHSATRPLSITHIGPCLLHGGAEQHLRSLAAFLDPRRAVIERCIVTQANQCAPEVATSLGIPVVVGGREAVRDAAQKSDVLLFWGVALDSWLGHCRPRLCVYLAHGESHWTRRLLCESAQVTDHAIAVSQRAQHAVCDGFPSTVIHNGVDTARLTSTRSRDYVRSRLGFRHDDFVLGIVARYSPEKRFELLIETIAGLPSNFKMLAVGCGSRLDQLLRLANENIPNRYAFVEAQTYLGDYYQAMDAYCMTSEHEGFGLVVLEAMFHGLPVIATCVGAVPELVQHGRSGVIVPDDPRAFREAARELQSRPLWAKAMGGEAQAYARQHGYAADMAEKYAALLESLWCNKFGGR